MGSEGFECVCPSQIEVLSADPQVIAADDPDATPQLEALSTGIPRVEQDHAPPSLEAGQMRMAEDDSVGFLPAESVPMSPACRMWSTAAKSLATLGSRKPWVSEITPMVIMLGKLLFRSAVGLGK